MKLRMIVTGIVVLVIFNVTTFLFIKARSPLDNKYPFFTDEEFRVGKVHWEYRVFQPIYQGVVQRNDEYFLKGLYLNTKGYRRKILIFIGKKEADDSIRLVAQFMSKNKEKLPKKIKNISELDGVFKVGQQIKVEYLISAPDFDNLEKNTTFCNDLPAFCELARRMAESGVDYEKFSVSGSLSAGKTLNATTVYEL
ncbi:MAG: hypothetical protein U0946_00820 [Patescibacteria group bacterium]|nr:hypothetical protein [Patescibacteria group bacterium]